MKRILLACCLAAIASDARFVDPKIEGASVVLAKQETVPGKAASLLPKEKKWRLVWHDEFDGAEIDKTKWMCRESFWGQDFPAFAHDFEGVEMTGETVKLHTCGRATTSARRISRRVRSHTTSRKTPPAFGRSVRTASRSS